MSLTIRQIARKFDDFRRKEVRILYPDLVTTYTYGLCLVLDDIMWDTHGDVVHFLPHNAMPDLQSDLLFLSELADLLAAEEEQ